MIELNPKELVISLADPEIVEVRKNAESKNILFHYCKIKSLEKILRKKAFLFNNLTKRNAERIGVNEKFDKVIYLASFSSNEQHQELWDAFGDKERGVRLEFKYNGPFHTAVVDKDSLIEAYSVDEELLYRIGFNSSSYDGGNIFYSPNEWTDFTLDIVLSDVIYSEKKEFSEHQNCLNLTTISKRILTRWDKQMETRMIGVLRSKKHIFIEEIDYLLIPMDFSSFDLNVKFGDKVTEIAKNNVRNLIQETKLDNVRVT